MSAKAWSSGSALTLPWGGGGQSLGDVLAGADEGATDGDAVRDHVDQRNREIPRSSSASRPIPLVFVLVRSVGCDETAKLPI